MYSRILAGVGVGLLLLGGTLILLGASFAPAPLAPVATTTLVAVENPEPIETPRPEPAAPAEVAPVPASAPASTPAVKPAPQPTLPLPPQPTQPTQTEFEATTILLRSALVNILCVSGDPKVGSISGSGVIVHPSGLIVTNTHIAQYYLLESDPSFDVTCTVRTGSPAKSAYKAKPAFVSPLWIAENADLFGSDHPTGTGEYDFAFLAITGSATSAALPSVFPFIPFSESEVYAGEPVVVGSYAAQFLTGGAILSNLYPTLVYGSLKEIFTFLQTTIDVVTVGGSAAAQEGSSGGGIARANGTLVSVITTSTIEGETSTRTLAGITASYIRRDYEIEAGHSLATLFAKSPVQAAADFAPQIAALRAKLAEQIVR